MLIDSKQNEGQHITDKFIISEEEISTNTTSGSPSNTSDSADAETSDRTIEGEERFGASFPDSFNLSLEEPFATTFMLKTKSYAAELRANNNEKLMSELAFLKLNWASVTSKIETKFGSKSPEDTKISELSGFITTSIQALNGLQERNVSFFVNSINVNKAALDTATLILAYNVSFEPEEANPTSAVGEPLEPVNPDTFESIEEDVDREAALASEAAKLEGMVRKDESAIVSLLAILARATQDENLPNKTKLVSNQLTQVINDIDQLNKDFETEAKLIASENEFAAAQNLMAGIKRLNEEFIANEKRFQNAINIPESWNKQFKGNSDYNKLNEILKDAKKKFNIYEKDIKTISGVSNKIKIDEINEKLKRVKTLDGFNKEFVFKLSTIPNQITQASQFKKDPEKYKSAISLIFTNLQTILTEDNKKFLMEVKAMTQINSEIKTFVESIKKIIKVEKKGTGFFSSGSLQSAAKKLVDDTRNIEKLKDKLKKPMQETSAQRPITATKTESAAGPTPSYLKDDERKLITTFQELYKEFFELESERKALKDKQALTSIIEHVYQAIDRDKAGLLKLKEDITNLTSDNNNVKKEPIIEEIESITSQIKNDAVAQYKDLKGRISEKNLKAHEDRMQEGKDKNTVLDHLARIMTLTTTIITLSEKIKKELQS